MYFAINFLIVYIYIYIYIYLARTPEIGQGLGRILSCGARKPEQTYMSIIKKYKSKIANLKNFLKLCPL